MKKMEDLVKKRIRKYSAKYRKRQKLYRLIHNSEIKEKNRLYRLANKEKIKEKHRLYRLAHKEELKNKAKLYRLINKDKIKLARYLNRDKIIQKSKERYLKNIDKIREKDRIKYRNNPERKKQYSLYYHNLHKEDLRYKEKRSKYKKEYYQNNKEKIKISNRIYVQGIGKEKARENCRRRRARKKNVIHVFTMEEWRAKCEATRGICPSCKLFVGIDNLTLDHIYALYLANIDYLNTGIKRIYTIDDVQPLCFRCNNSKRDKLVIFPTI